MESLSLSPNSETQNKIIRGIAMLLVQAWQQGETMYTVGAGPGPALGQSNWCSSGRWQFSASPAPFLCCRHIPHLLRHGVVRASPPEALLPACIYQVCSLKNPTASTHCRTLPPLSSLFQFMAGSPRHGVEHGGAGTAICFQLLPAPCLGETAACQQRELRKEQVP